MKKNLKFFVEIAIFAALAVVFDFVCGFIPDAWLNGGSISIAMVPILLMGYRHGLKGGLLTGLIVGSVQLIYARYIIAFGQVMLDYVLAYTVIGCSALLWHNLQEKNKWLQNLFIILGTLIGIFLRLLCATLSGNFYWETALIPSFTYNLTYLLPSYLICVVIMIILLNTLPKKLLKQEYLTKSNNNIDNTDDTEYIE